MGNWRRKVCNYGATGNLPELHYVFDCASQTCISLETCLISVLIYIGAARPSMKVKHTRRMPTAAPEDRLRPMLLMRSGCSAEAKPRCGSVYAKQRNERGRHFMWGPLANLTTAILHVVNLLHFHLFSEKGRTSAKRAHR